MGTMRASKARSTMNERSRTVAKEATKRSPALRQERRGRSGSAKVRAPLSWVDDPRAPGRRMAKARGGIYSIMDADGTGRWIANWHPNDEAGKRRGRKVSLAFLVPERAAAVQACEEHFLERQTTTAFFADDAASCSDPALSGPAVAWKRARR
jgi:hypothetical protein